jgi:hypothetical protein
VTVFLERVILAILTGLALFLVLGPNPMHFNWPQRIGSLMVILVLAGLVSWGINRLNKKRAGTPSIQNTLTDGRIFVPAAPEDLAGIYDKKTEVQGARAAEIYLGKWIQVSGKVTDVSADHTVLIKSDGDGMTVFLRFPRKESDRLQILPRGHFLKVNGQIKRITPNWVMLENCELVEI